MKIYKNRQFNRWAHKSGLSDLEIITAVKEIEKNMVEANLGGNLYKKRVATGSKGKRAGARTIVAYRFRKKAFFLYGFSKNEKSNIDIKEENVLRELGNFYLGLSDLELQNSISEKKLYEVKYEE